MRSHTQTHTIYTTYLKLFNKFKRREEATEMEMVEEKERKRGKEENVRNNKIKTMSSQFHVFFVRNEISVEFFVSFRFASVFYLIKTAL